MRNTILLILALIFGGATSVYGQSRADDQDERLQPVQNRSVQLPGLNRRVLQTLSTVPLDMILPSARQLESLSEKDSRRLQPRAGRSPRRSADEVPVLDDFPYQAQDFAADERVLRGKTVHNPENPASTWQQFAYDIGVSKMQEDDTWSDFKLTTDWNDPKNSDFYIYRKPVYAVNEGVVVNCWRNAPENPRPHSGKLDTSYVGMPLIEMTWLHQDTREGKVFGSGNFIVVEEDSGNFVHYAHARPGTVPAKLCPHTNKLLSPGSWEADSAVPVAQQVRVKRGDYLFETGNSGTSSAPHLHLDRTESDKATSVRLRFRHGLSKTFNLSTRKTTQDKWQSFKGRQIPSGPVLVWPPRRTGGDWSWNGMKVKDWEDYFAHMADSGYQMTWIDGYQVKKKPYFNTIWKTATKGWLGHALLTGADYQKVMDDALEDGFAPVHVDSVLSNGKARYNAIFVKGVSTDFYAHHGQSNSSFNASFQAHTKEGYSPVSVSVISVNGTLRYTTLYRKQNLGGWVLEPGIRSSNYQAVYDQNKNLGRRPFLVNAFKHKNRSYYSVLFSERPTGARKDKHGMSPEQYQHEFNTATGLSIKAISGIDGASSQHRYIAVWRSP